ncbi:cation-translocating P-type ATPase [Dongia rigui]|uniref:Cation-translocating P-type ATPase n=1 Tax=Dongia rigui TaxID=940149 RepID=A0ABU5DW94_9PROT|nr:cation-translocating P-type ATPase [Dongia rigui]MDY0870978.1 cation-translocating P-type ATPase [Dongia rigui]
METQRAGPVRDAAAGALGLTRAEAQRRLERDGANELPGGGTRSVWTILGEVVREPMLALLLCGGGIYFLIGSRSEALILLGFATFSVIVTLVQETRTERVLEALRDLSSPRALVIRDGKHQRIAGSDVVVGDLVILGEGDRVPADLTLTEANDLLADESLLTGESLPVRKAADNGAAATDPTQPGGDDLAAAFSGTLIVRGSGTGEVTATGARSQIGRIGASLAKVQVETPRLQGQTAKLVRIFAGIAALCSLTVILLYGLSRGDWLQGILAGIALGMSLIPEEFPVVLAVFTAMGAWRLSRGRVLTRRAATIETLGAATTLCTDKTGTLTENRMSVTELRAWSGEALTLARDEKMPLPQPFAAMVEIGRRACAETPFDPMEKAFHDLGPRLGASGTWRLRQSYGLRPDLLAMSNVWTTENGCVVAAKGAPEAIAELCRLGAADRAALKILVDAMGQGGMRVLGVARADLAAGDVAAQELPETQRGFAFTFLGLVGLTDPLRAGVPEAVAQCRSAGIRVVMITGDYPATARAIAESAGIDGANILTGAEIDALDDAALGQRLGQTGVFARILPQQKLRLVEAFKAQGEIVAMTGDGVNDAPSLKAAHIGIAMGRRGTDVAREASSIVLLDDDFTSIVGAIRLGRRIYDNLRKAMGFIIAVHVPIAGLALLPLLFGLPVLFGPLHIAFLEMVIDPVCTLVFEAEEDENDIMGRPPRPPEAPLFSKPLLVWSFLQGLVTLALTGATFIAAWLSGMAGSEIRALVFAMLVLSIVALILVNRAFSPSLRLALGRHNRALALVLAAVALVLAAAMLAPALRELFHFSPLHLADFAAIFGAVVVLWLGLERGKKLLGRRLAG